MIIAYREMKAVEKRVGTRLIFQNPRRRYRVRSFPWPKQ